MQFSFIIIIIIIIIIMYDPIQISLEGDARAMQAMYDARNDDIARAIRQFASADEIEVLENRRNEIEDHVRKAYYRLNSYLLFTTTADVQ